MKIAVVGLGYVGLPLAMALSQKFAVVGYDIDEQRVAELNEGLDSTREFSSAEIQEARISLITNDEQVLQDCVAFIV
ncbi:NAD(P)-binding domain-containing protein, partial [Acinetobacter baumannii]